MSHLLDMYRRTGRRPTQADIIDSCESVEELDAYWSGLIQHKREIEAGARRVYEARRELLSKRAR